jgi:hypothetical protein
MFSKAIRRASRRARGTFGVVAKGSPKRHPDVMILTSVRSSWDLSRVKNNNQIAVAEPFLIVGLERRPVIGATGDLSAFHGDIDRAGAWIASHNFKARSEKFIEHFWERRGDPRAPDGPDNNFLMARVFD